MMKHRQRGKRGRMIQSGCFPWGIGEKEGKAPGRNKKKDKRMGMQCAKCHRSKHRVSI